MPETNGLKGFLFLLLLSGAVLEAQEQNELSLPDLYIPRAKRQDIQQPEQYPNPLLEWNIQPISSRRIYLLDVRENKENADRIDPELFRYLFPESLNQDNSLLTDEWYNLPIYKEGQP